MSRSNLILYRGALAPIPLAAVLTTLMFAAGSRAAAATAAKAKHAPSKQSTQSAAAAKSREAAGTSFPAFCEGWMQKLADREHDNVGHIKWDSKADGVEGTYVGYSQEHSCALGENTKTAPVGKIFYREVRYEKRGHTIPEAEQSTPRPVEIYEVTEIFRYSKGKWEYE